MARSITSGAVKCTLTASLRNTVTDGSVASITVGGLKVNTKLDSGVEAEEANRAWQREGVRITSGGTEDIDLYDFAGIDIGGGAGNDGLGQAMALEEIMGLLLVSDSTSVGQLEIMPANPANYWTCMPKHTVALGNALKAGGALLIFQPNTDAFDVVDASSHVIRLGANGGNVDYSMYILARHDDELSSSSSSTSSQSSLSSSSTSSLSSSSTSSQSSSSSTSSLSSSSSSP